MAHKGSSSACQNKVILMNKSLSVGRFKAPMPVKGLICFIDVPLCKCTSSFPSQELVDFGLYISLPGMICSEN